jgi:hypothetical protein
MAPRSLRFVFGAAAALAACAEPVIEMRLELPPADKAARFDVSCVGAVEVFVRGTDRGLPGGFTDPGTPADDVYDCITVDGVSSYAELRQAIAGRFQLALPDSGLAGVDVRGSTGTCKKDNAPGDTIFYAAAEHDGGDALVIPMTPNQSCNKKSIEDVRPVDLLALTRSGVCPPPVPDGADRGVDSATMHPTALNETYFDYNGDYAGIAGGVAKLPLYPSTGDEACIAVDYWENADVMTSMSCVRRGPGVCSTPDQIELPIISYAAAGMTVDIQAVDAYGGAVIGGVWGTTPTGGRVKLPSATVKPARPADADKVKIVYADYPAGAMSPRELPGATATNATGLFIAYVGRPIDFIVSAAGYADEIVRMGSPDDPSTALIVLTRP